MSLNFFSFFSTHHKKRVVVVESNLSPVTEELQALLFEMLTIRMPDKVSCFAVNGGGNGMALRDMIGEYAAQGIDLFLTNGLEATLIAKEFTTSYDLTTPIVFLNLSYPRYHRLIKEYTHSENNVTGVIMPDYGFQDYADHITNLFPRAKQVLLLFQPSEHDYCENRVPRLSQLLTQTGRSVHSIPLVYKKDAVIQIEQAIHRVKPEVIVMLGDPVVLSCLYTIVTLAERYMVPVFACDVTSVSLGASLGYGFSYQELALHAAARVSKILVDQWQPQSLPIAFCKPLYALRLNRRAMRSQGLILDSQGYDWFFEHGGKLS